MTSDSAFSLTSRLMKAGLKKNEALVYFHLICLGETKIGPLLAATKLSKQSLYNILLSLHDEGLLDSEKQAGKAATYAPAPPQVFFSRLENLRSETEMLVPALEMLQGSGHVVGDVSVIEGTLPFQRFVEKQLKMQTEGTMIDILGAGGDSFLKIARQRAFFTRYENIRIGKKLGHRLLMYGNQRNTNSEYTKRRYVSVRYLPQLLQDSPVATIIWPDSISIFLFGDEPRIIHVKSAKVRQGFSAYFASLWETAQE